MLWVAIVIVAFVVLHLRSSSLYNRLVRLRNRCENAWAQVDVQLKRRHDLIPNLVETVKGYASHERATFEEVTKARTAAQQAQGPAEQAAAENMLTQAIGRLFAVAEAYPQLRATENFQQLQAQLADTESKIAVSRQVYNDTVLSYDNALETVPTNIVAGIFRFKPREYFEIEDAAAREAPQVQFSRADSASPSRSPPARSSWRARRRRRRSPSRSPTRASPSRSSPTGRSTSASTITVRLRRAVHRRLPRHPAARGRVDLRRLGRGERAAVQPRRLGRARLERDARHVRHGARPTTASGSSGTTAPSPRCARSRSRTRCRGLAVAYDDVVDVNLQVWGDEWEEPLGQLSALDAPPRRRRAASELPRLGPPGVGARRRRRAARWTRRCARSTSRPASSSRCASSSRATCSPRPRARRFGPATASTRSSPRSEPTRVAYEDEPAEDRRREGPPRPHAAHPARCSRCCPALAVIGGTYWFYGRERAHRLRPRVRAGAAERPRARARPDAAPPVDERRGGRVHGDALRPDPPRPLQVDAGHDREVDLGRPAQAGRRRPRADAPAKSSS